MTTTYTVIDVCCGSRMFWFDKYNSRAIFIDNRLETWPIDKGTPGTIGRSPIVVRPDLLADFINLPFKDNSFPLVVFDPPHIEREKAKGLLTKKYGCLNGNWQETLKKGFVECFRVLKPQGTLIFKWADSDHPVSEILELVQEKPLFGHKSGKRSATHWLAFQKTYTATAGNTVERDCFDMLLTSQKEVSAYTTKLTFVDAGALPKLPPITSCLTPLLVKNGAPVQNQERRKHGHKHSTTIRRHPQGSDD